MFVPSLGVCVPNVLALSYHSRLGFQRWPELLQNLDRSKDEKL